MTKKCRCSAVAAAAAHEIFAAGHSDAVAISHGPSFPNPSSQLFYNITRLRDWWRPARVSVSQSPSYLGDGRAVSPEFLRGDQFINSRRRLHYISGARRRVGQRPLALYRPSSEKYQVAVRFLTRSLLSD
jgi:hypothetical protein